MNSSEPLAAVSRIFKLPARSTADFTPSALAPLVNTPPLPALRPPPGVFALAMLALVNEGLLPLAGVTNPPWLVPFFWCRASKPPLSMKGAKMSRICSLYISRQDTVTAPDTSKPVSAPWRSLRSKKSKMKSPTDLGCESTNRTSVSKITSCTQRRHWKKAFAKMTERASGTFELHYRMSPGFFSVPIIECDFPLPVWP